MNRLRRAASDILPWFGAIVLLVQLGWIWNEWSDPVATSVDSSQLIVMARRLEAGLELYRDWPEYGPHFMTTGGPVFPPDRSPYLPFLPSLLTPISGITLANWARLVWCSSLIAFWGYALALATLAGKPTWGRTFAWGTALMLTPGAWRAVAIGNVDPLIWALAGLALVSSRTLGAGLALAAMVKVYPAWPLLVGALREPRKVLPGALVATLLVSGTAAIAVGPTSLLEHLGAWLLHVPPVMSQGSFLFWNFSLSFLPLRLLEGVGVWDYGGGPLPGAARVYLTTMGLAAPLLTGWLTRECRPRLQYGAVLSAAVLFAPLGWATYVPLALAPVALLMSGSRDEAHSSLVARST